MLQPTYSPLAVDKIAGLLLHLESAPCADMAVIGMAVKHGSVAVPHVVVTLEDGTRHPIDPDDARLMARCIRDDYGQRHTRAERWAESLEGGAQNAERQADAIRQSLRTSNEVTPLRAYGSVQ